MTAQLKTPSIRIFTADALSNETERWLHDISTEYGCEAADKCAAIIAEANAIRQLCIDAGSPECTLGQMETAKKLYAAGYRKFEIVDE